MKWILLFFLLEQPAPSLPVNSPQAFGPFDNEAACMVATRGNLMPWIGSNPYSYVRCLPIKEIPVPP